jgi:hypothetical protein
MNNPRQWIDGYLDDALTADQQVALSDWIKADPENARIFAEAALLHDRLQNTVAMDRSVSHLPELGQSSVLSDRRDRSFSSFPVWSTAASIAVLLAGAAVLWFSSGPSTASDAFRELDRILIRSMQWKDRTYEIVVEDIASPSERGNRTARQDTRRPPKPPLDGATLHIRQGNQFVLIRKTSEGLPFITGSNGKQSWAVNTRGSVKVSSDIHHFDHDLPGHETSVPLANLHEGLEQLKRSYHLQFSSLGPEEYETQQGENVRLLVAVKKPKVRGPQRVEITYDSNTGRILSMRFVQMPYGPDRLDLRLSLVNENELPIDVFEYTSHQSPDSVIEMEN